jgi:hypothetical protein
MNPITIMISLTATFGVFMHDTRLDQVIANVATPAIASHSSVEHIRSYISDQHVHSESNSFDRTAGAHMQQPTIKPRDQDDKKYIAQKKLMGSGSSEEYFWPSI